MIFWPFTLVPELNYANLCMCFQTWIRFGQNPIIIPSKKQISGIGTLLSTGCVFCSRMKWLCLLLFFMFDLVFPHWKESWHRKRAVWPCLLFDFSAYILLFGLNYFFLIFAHLYSLNLACHKNLHSMLKVLSGMVILKLIAYVKSEYVVFRIFYINNQIYINVLSRAFTRPFWLSLHLPNCMSAWI